jgi:dihydroxyacid dehydratase/phosphogluconate dehydratase
MRSCRGHIIRIVLPRPSSEAYRGREDWLRSFLCATDAALERLAEEAGRTVLENLKSNRRARDVMSETSFMNMVKVACATSGSTNLTIHFPAIAHE